MKKNQSLTEEEQEFLLISQSIQKSLEDTKDKSELIQTINMDLFKKYCLKQYLDKCEPEFCIYRLSDSCVYFKLVKYIYNKIGINIVGKENQ